MKIIRHRERTVRVTFLRLFDYTEPDRRGWGFAFDCDEQGNVKATDANRANFEGCLAGSVNGHPVVDRGVQRYENTYTAPAVGECECGAEVILDGFTCTCDDCGADYNSAGQRLAPREQWGEETGEHPADIARIR